MHLQGVLVLWIAFPLLAGEQDKAFQTAATTSPERFPGPAYEAKGAYKVGAHEVRAYAQKTGAAAKGSTPGQFLFVVQPPPLVPLEPDSPLLGKAPAYAYRVDATRKGQEHVRFDVFVVDPSSPGAEREKGDWPRVIAQSYTAAQADYQSARALVEKALAAADAWDAPKVLVAAIEDLFEDSESCHNGWVKIAADLERAREIHPGHFGILRDLIVAYTRLLVYERATPRGSNLCSLIPEAIAQYRAAAGPLTPAEERTFHQVLAMLLFHMELYPLAQAEIEAVKDDEQLADLHKVLKALGQAEFEKAEFPVPGAPLPCTVRVYKSRSVPPSGKALFHHWYFVPHFGGSPEAVPAAWYTLSSQPLTDAPRYYLYGFSGNQRKMLRLFGRQQPAYEEVKALIGQSIQAALPKPKEAQTQPAARSEPSQAPAAEKELEEADAADAASAAAPVSWQPIALVGAIWVGIICVGIVVSLWLIGVGRKGG